VRESLRNNKKKRKVIMTYRVVAERNGYDASSEVTLGEFCFAEFSSREEAEEVVASLESDKADYGLENTTYSVVLI
jgi:hypothetical protein